MLSAFGRFNERGGGAVHFRPIQRAGGGGGGGGGGVLSTFGRFNERGGGGGGVMSTFGRFMYYTIYDSTSAALSADPVIQSVGGGC